LRARGASLCQAALQNIIIPAVNLESELLDRFTLHKTVSHPFKLPLSPPSVSRHA